MANDFGQRKPGTWYKTVRLSREISEEQLAEGTGLAVSTIRRIESNTALPKKQDRDKIERYLEVGFGTREADLLSFREEDGHSSLDTTFEESAYDCICPGGHQIRLADNGVCPVCQWKASNY